RFSLSSPTARRWRRSFRSASTSSIGSCVARDRVPRMTQRTLVLRGLTYYWRTNAAVVVGVATPVAVLAGALLVGDSVRGSLRDLVLQRLGRADQVVSSAGFFREGLAEALASDLTSGAGCPVIAVEGAVTNQTGGRRVSRVQVYGVDDRFWRFHGLVTTGPG